MVVKRLFDICFATVAIVLLWPIFILAALGIRMTSPGPIFYRAKRTGLNGIVFTMYKFRTMHVEQSARCSVITAHDDPRVFGFGNILRKLKIDELPQLFNVLRGDMSIVGPRPEDPKIVDQYYTSYQRKTLTVRPGLASPGSIYNYTHGNQLLKTDTPETAYIQNLLPIKLALESVYVQRVSLLYDLRIILRTIVIILATTLGFRHFPEPPEMALARQVLESNKS